MMEIQWQNLFSDMEMEGEGEFLKEQQSYNKVNSFDQEDDEALDLGDILQLQYYPANSFSSESTETLSPSAIGASSSSTLSFDDTTAAGGGIIGGFNDDDSNNNNRNNKRCKILSKSSSSNSIASQLVPLENLPPPPPAAETNSSSPKSCIILSFDDDSSASREGGGGRKKQQQGGGGSSRGLRCSSNCNQRQQLSGAKKTRNSSESLDHIMAERKRRQELTERFIALSATIPGLKKIDKASILSEAINYVKQLQERIKKLENESTNKVKVESFMISRGTEDATTDGSSKTNNSSGSSSDHEYYCHRSQLSNSNVDLLSWLPEVEARALEKQVLLRIHCQKQSSVMLNVLAHLKALHLSVISSSVLPFGNSALDITIIAQMGEKYKGTVKELVKSMRMSLLVESPDDIQQSNRDP